MVIGNVTCHFRFPKFSVDYLIIAHHLQTKKYVVSICGSAKAPRVVVERVNAN